MILTTAWKNVWRNKTRSMVVITSMTIGVFAGIFFVGLMNGMIGQRFEAALNQEIAHIHLNQKGFNDNFDIQYTLKDIEKINSEILEIEGVEALSNRVVVSAMANTATKSMGVQLVGINPDQEMAILDLDQTILPGTGKYLGKESRSNLAFIGEDLAKELNIIRFRIEQSAIDSMKIREVPDEILVKLEPYIGKRFSSQKAFSKEMKSLLSPHESYKYGKIILEESWSFRARSKMTLTFIDKDNVQTGGMFRIAGIYDVKNSMFEKSQIFVLNSDLQRLTGLNDNDYHQTIVRIADIGNTEQITESIAEIFPKLEVRNWKEIQPDLAMMSGMIEKILIAFMVIILAALSFGIVNTMLMVVLERTKELGMLSAIGMNKKKIFSMIMTESVFLTLVGGIVGMIFSWIVISFTASNGINFAGAQEGFEALGFPSHIYPTISNSFFVIITILIVITGILSSIYPARKALKLDPADALRTE